MPLQPGTRLGPYEVVSALGAGGMGEVYRARDTRLHRTVALKIIAADGAVDARARQRFQREALAIAALDHPHICALFDVGEQDGIDFLVMQYLEGESLAERLRRGPLPPGEALGYAAEIAEALARAHAAGIVHRDLKPANVMLTKSGAKLLDFGIATTLSSHAGRWSDPAAAPTGGLPAVHSQGDADGATAPGIVVGSLPYMAPEQLRGHHVDGRADLFALGAILYEMLSGRRAFTAPTDGRLVSAILEQEPEPLSAVAPAVPAPVERLVIKCLQKAPDARWQTARDLADALRWLDPDAPSAPTEPPVVVARSRRGPMLLAVVALALALGAAYWSGVGRDAAGVAGGPAPINLSIAIPKDLSFESVGDTELALSPDGRRVVFRAGSADGKRLLYVRSLASPELRALPGSDYGRRAFWSPDGASIGFFAYGKLVRVDLAQGTPKAICDAPSARGGTWNASGTIVFAPAGGENGLYAVSAEGGAPRQVTTVDRARRERVHAWPTFLPDGRRFLYVVRGDDAGSAGTYVQSLESGERTRVAAVTSNVVYADGHLLFANEAALMAVPFDADTARVTGEPFQVGTGVRTFATRADFSAVGSVLGYWRASETSTHLTSIGRDGGVLKTQDAPLNIGDPALSPDGRFVAFSHARDIWTIDLATGSRRRMTTGNWADYYPVWSPDGARLIFASNRPEGVGLFELQTATGVETPLHLDTEELYPTDWSRDGRYVLFERRDNRSRTRDLWALPMTGDRTPVPVAVTGADEREAKISPDNRWVAYTTNATGHWEVYLRRFPGPAGVQQVSSDGGVQPVWSPDGRELFFLDRKPQLLSTRISDGAGPSFSPPRSLFRVPVATLHPRSLYALSSDGLRFLFTTAPPRDDELITIVEQWAARPAVR